MEVVLRRFAEVDDPGLAALAADPDVCRWNPLKPDGDPVTWRAKVAADPRAETFAITHEDDRLLGTIALFDVDHEQGTAELGYRVHPDERGRGVATAAVRAAASYGFGALGLRRLQLFHVVANPASCGAATRAGFALEGTLRQGYVYGDGTAYDEHLHARLATD